MVYISRPSNIIPEGGIDIGLTPIASDSDGTDSVLGSIEDRAKDLMRLMGRFKGVSELPIIRPADKLYPYQRIEVWFHRLRKSFADLALERPSGYVSLIKLKR
ncbi:hypothetical protein O0L34_g16072 [Tuta absoluta]|nr:hypothetical protein O0L34_g16072 [Tuta absoluta]